MQRQDADYVWHRIVLAAICPMLFQLYLLYWVFIWAEEDGLAAGFMPLAATLLMIAAVPIALVANVWVVYETRHWRIYWVVAVGYFQAAIIPVAIAYQLLTP